jgi:hypothetical protein
MAERCHICDRPKAPVMDPYDIDRLEECWGDSRCRRLAVDWRARALAAEEALRTAVDALKAPTGRAADISWTPVRRRENALAKARAVLGES